ncbi:MAG: ABC transporter substrate-binding protein [Burkholderiaceae bacterium]|nr:ABC transporter substrate-binding protein [Burkholderiaceae bacterium]
MKNAYFLSAALAVSAAIGASPASAQTTLRIGVVASLSGPGTAWGNAILGAAQFAADDVNAKGGLEVGGKKYTVSIVSYDDKYKANDAQTAMNRLIFDDKINIVLGPVGTAPALAALPLASENKVLTMTMAWGDKALGPNLPYSFRPVVPAQVFAEPQIRWVVGKLGSKRVGALFPNDATGQDASNVFDAAYTKAGAKLVAKESFERERIDFVPLLTRVLAQNIDLFEIGGTPPDSAGMLIKQLREMGYKGPIVSTAGDAVAEIVRIAGTNNTDNIYVHRSANTDVPAVKQYAERYSARFKAPMNGFSPFFYASMEMLFESMKNAGTVSDTEKIRAALLSLNGFPTMVGKATWMGQAKWGSNQQLSVPVYVGLLKNGQASIVATCTPEKCE